MLRIERPEYAHLYRALRKLRLQPIGVEFVSHPGQLDGEFPVEWQSMAIDGGFSLMHCQQQWSNVRHAATRSGDSVVATVGGKIGTYLELLNLRLLHLSGAYSVQLRSCWRGTRTSGALVPHLFSHLFMRDIEAVIHAFLADAASFRDVLAEACWSLVLRKTAGQVNTLAELRKRVKGATDPVIIEILEQSSSGGWIKNLTDLRNHVVHVAPVSHAHELSFCEIRSMPIEGTELLTLHYPLTEADWSLRRGFSRIVNFSDEGAVRTAYEAFKEFSSRSGDALEYCWRTVSLMVKLADAVRIASGLRAETPKVQPIPGSVRLHSSGTGEEY